MAIESTTIVTLYDDASMTKAFAPRTKVEAISNDSGTGLQALLDAKMNANNNKFTNGIEIHHATTPFIDFHYESNQGDYTSRIIESSSGTLDINGVTFNSSKITSGIWNGSTIGLAYGGTGATTAAGALTNLGLTATATELNYCEGVTSNIQTQLNGKQATITGGASTITSNNLTTSRALISNSSGKVAVSAVTSTELGYLDGVTSAIQTQLDGKASSSHTHSYLPLSGGTLTGNLTTSGNFILQNGNSIKAYKPDGSTLQSVIGLSSANNIYIGDANHTGNVNFYGENVVHVSNGSSTQLTINSGDTFTGEGYTAAAYITNSGKDLFFSFPIGFKVSNNISTVTCKSLKMNIRHVGGGYVGEGLTSGGYEYVGASGYTITAYLRKKMNTITIKMAQNVAYGTINNTPLAIDLTSCQFVFA